MAKESKDKPRSHKRKSKPEPPKFEFIPVKHEFSPEERDALGKSLAQHVEARNRLEEEKKNITADFSNRIKVELANINQLSLKVNAGYEMRDTECRVEFNTPKRKKKYYHRATGKLICEMDMKPSDLVLEFPGMPASKETKKAEKEKKKAATKAQEVAVVRHTDGDLPNPALQPGAEVAAVDKTVPA